MHTMRQAQLTVHRMAMVGKTESITTPHRAAQMVSRLGNTFDIK